MTATTLESLARIGGSTSIEACRYLAALAQGVEPYHAIVELSAHRARVACHVAHGAMVGKGAKVWAVDPWDLPGQSATYTSRMSNGIRYTRSSVRRSVARGIASSGLANRITMVRGFPADVASDWTGPRVAMLIAIGVGPDPITIHDIEPWIPHLIPGAMVALAGPSEDLWEKLCHLTRSDPANHTVVDDTLIGLISGVAPESTPEKVEVSTDADLEHLVEPPRSGPGSGRDAWIAYATAVTGAPADTWENLSRDGIIAYLADGQVGTVSD